MSQVPSHHLTLTLYREWCKEDSGNSAPGRDRIRLLFELLDYAAWRNDIRPWRSLSRELTQCAAALDPGATSTTSTTALVDSVQRAWTIRRDWWPAYHFSPASLPRSTSVPSEETVSLIGYKATVAYFLLAADNSYTQAALTLVDDFVVKTKGMSQLKKVVRNWSTLPLDS